MAENEPRTEPYAEAFPADNLRGNAVSTVPARKYGTDLVPEEPVQHKAIELLQLWIEEDGDARSATFEEEEAELLRNRFALRRY